MKRSLKYTRCCLLLSCLVSALCCEAVPTTPLSQPQQQLVNKYALAEPLAQYLQELNKFMTRVESLNELRTIHQLLSPFVPGQGLLSNLPVYNIQMQLEDQLGKIATNQELAKFLSDYAIVPRNVAGQELLTINLDTLLKHIALSGDYLEFMHLVAQAEQNPMYWEDVSSYSVAQMAQFAYDYEQFLNKDKVDVGLRMLAKTRWQYYMNYLLDNDLMGSTGFDSKSGKLRKRWVQDLTAFTQDRQGQSADLVAEYLKLLNKNNNSRLNEQQKAPLLHKITAAFDLQIPQKIEDFPGRLTAAEKRLLGQHQLAFDRLQLPASQVYCNDSDEGIFMGAMQGQDDDYLDVSGYLSSESEESFMLNGVLNYSLSTAQGTEQCHFEGQMEFKSHDNGKSYQLMPLKQGCMPDNYKVIFNL